MSFRIERGQIIPSSNNTTKKQVQSTNVDFQRILQESIDKKDNIRISAHAEQRMAERNIKLQQSDIERLKDAMNDLEKKGARESLMLYKDMAFIASVRNRTIITTMQNNDMEIVTNIDSAIIVK
jgi:flagellar operon protein